MFSQQYCLWDLFREMGEPIGSDGSTEGDGERVIAKVRLRNYARTYAWWTAKGPLTLTILKVRDPRLVGLNDFADRGVT